MPSDHAAHTADPFGRRSLLANLAQLQPQVASEQPIFARLSMRVVESSSFAPLMCGLLPCGTRCGTILHGCCRDLGVGARVAAPESSNPLACGGHGVGRDRLAVLHLLPGGSSAGCR